MENTSLTIQPFLVKTCALAAMATGEYVSSLLELRSKVATIEASSIYFHFWGGKMNASAVDAQHHNDFSSWVSHCLHDSILGERLSVIDPTEFESLDALRQEVLEVIERRLDECDTVLWTKKDDWFHFICSSIIVLESALTIPTPKDLVVTVPILPPSSIFYHFIDARSRTLDKTDDFSVWLKQFGAEYEPLVEAIQAIDPYFLSLTQIKEELGIAIQRFFEQRGLHG